MDKAYLVLKREKDFFDKLELSENVKRKYRSALNSTFLSEMLVAEFQTETIFDITNLDILWKVYSLINLHPKNVSNHRVYSSAIMRYIRYLNNGKKIGRRIDYQKKKSRLENPI